MAIPTRTADLGMKRSLVTCGLFALSAVGCSAKALDPSPSGGASSGASAGSAAEAGRGSSGEGGGSAGTFAAGGDTASASGAAGFGGDSTASFGGDSAAGGASGAAGGASGAAGESAMSGPIVTPPGYALVWHDEFDVDGPPNPANFKFEQGFVRNEEAQWYQSSNARVQGGLLVIEARRETVTNPRYTGTGDWKTTRRTAEYTSSCLNTSGLWSFQYGHFEMRARIPTAAGMWPAWWTLGVARQWPSNGEVDIMEFYQNKLLANVASGTSTPYQAKWDSTATPLASLGAGWSAQFHVWTMDWDDQNIVLAVDGKQLNTTSLQSALNADGTSPFKQKAYLLVNLAIGGQNGGDPSLTPFPARLEVDYLRVFQKQ